MRHRNKETKKIKGYVVFAEGEKVGVIGVIETLEYGVIFDSTNYEARYLIGSCYGLDIGFGASSIGTTYRAFKEKQKNLCQEKAHRDSDIMIGDVVYLLKQHGYKDIQIGVE